MEMYEGEFAALVVERDGPAVTIKFREHSVDTAKAHGLINNHWELGEVISRLRGENDIRVIVLTGVEDGVFKRPALSTSYSDKEKEALRNDPQRMWRSFTGIARALEGILTIEKPVVAKVNGDAIGFGQSLLFACDLIVARQDAAIIDHHMSDGVDGRGSPYGLVPGDGGIGLVPAYFAPARAKEYLMLSRPYTAQELCNLGVINYAVPADELDAVADRMVSQLVSRSAYALAWTKRVANKGLVEQFNLRHDASAAFEMVNSYQAERMGWRPCEAL